MKTISTLILAAFALTAEARLRLPNILSDNMVMQAEKDACVWGWATPDAVVKVTPSWTGKAVTAKTGSDGKWKATLRMPKAGYTPLAISFEGDGSKLRLENILSGEVWVCAGQSNMEMPVEGFGNCPVDGYNEAVLDAKQRSAIRFVKIPSVMSTQPLDDADCKWEVTTMESVRRASATGYFFARTLHQALDIPIGLVMANKGGSRVESWLTEENLRKYTDENLDSMEMTKKFQWDFHYPLLWGNGTFNPILNYTVGGIIFYQGCSNVGDQGNKYSDNLALLVRQWREQFGQGDIPFFFVEIAPYCYEGNNGTSAALLREQQQRAATIIPNSALVCTNDLVYPYEPKQIHPAQKRQVGERLAWHALAKTYGQEGFMCESALVADWRFEGRECIVAIKNDYGAVAPFEMLEGFELAGEDRVFHKAVGAHNWQRGGYVLVCPEVEKPVAVRYCFRNFQTGNIKNRGGLPLFPFRSDNW